MHCIYTPRVLQCMRFRHIDERGTATRTVMDYEFDFCVGCDRDMWVEGERYKLESGSFVIRKPGQRVSSRGSYDCYMLTLDFSGRRHYGAYSRNIATSIQEPYRCELWDVLPTVFIPSHYGGYVRIFEALLSINEVDINEAPETLPLLNALIHLLISDAYVQHLPNKDHGTSPIDAVCSYIKAHYADDIDLDGLADTVHLNKNYLARQFKKRFGISPIAYLISCRLEYAKKLLAESELAVKTIAAECGYCDPSFFDRYFKKTFGISPMAYRRSRQNSAKEIPMLGASYPHPKE